MKRDTAHVRALQLAECVVCGPDGEVCIRAAPSGELVGMCLECDSVWLDVGLRDGPYALKWPDDECNGLCVWWLPAHWATREEAVRAGWSDAVVGEVETPESGPRPVRL